MEQEIDQFKPVSLWPAYLTVFISNISIMILELVAGRIIAPYVGSSLFTWTGVIGIVLAGISLGNYIGGYLADTRNSRVMLGAMLFFSGLSSLLIMYGNFVGDVLLDSGWNQITQILVYILALFFVPCLLLGTITPQVIKWYLQDLGETGRLVGKIYAVGTAASILGTFLTGYFLISNYGVFTIVRWVALVLLAVGLIYIQQGSNKKFWAASALFVAVWGGMLYTAYEGDFLDMLLNGFCTHETDYYCVQVLDWTLDGELVRVMILDDLIHSYTDLEDPTHFIYRYEKVFEDITRRVVDAKGAITTLTIGGGAYTFPNYLSLTYPDSQIEVVEIDPEITQIAYDSFGVREDTSIITYNEDARTFINRATKWGNYDLIFGDAYSGITIPYHLTTKEFNDRIHNALTPDGLYVVNIVDITNGDFTYVFARTLQESFDYVYLFTPAFTASDGRGFTYIFIAANQPQNMLVYEPLMEAGFIGRIQGPAELGEMLTEYPEIILTDEFAPVEQILAFGGR